MIETFTCPPISTNCYILSCSATNKAALIDAPFEAFPRVKPFLEKYSFNLIAIFITHSHWDHIADLKPFDEYFHCPIYVNELDKDNITNPGSDHLPSPIPLKQIDKVQIYKEGDKIQIGLLEIEVFHTPGHSPGGVCLYLKKQKVLFSGDTLFAKGIGRLDLPTSKEEKMWNSLKRLGNLPKDVCIYPGHGPITELGNTDFFRKM